MAGELGYETGPYVAVAALCDTVITGNDGVLSLVRLIDRVTVRSEGAEAPDELPHGVIQTNLVVVLKAGEARGAQRLAFVIENADGTRSKSQEMSVNFAPGPSGSVNVVSPVRLEVTSAGLYWFDVFVNDRLMTRAPLTVAYEFKR